MSDENLGGPTTRRSTKPPPDDLDLPSLSSTPPARTACSCCMYRQILLVVAILVCLVLGVYFKHFHRLPTEDILAANFVRQQMAAAEDYDDDQVADRPPSDAAKQSQRDWDRWIRRNRFVSIGKLFDKCGEISQIKCSYC